ncbi:MAG: ATP-dependent Clp protease proteolytic subunit, partial [Bryobacteraceae bacterium]
MYKLEKKDEPEQTVPKVEMIKEPSYLETVSNRVYFYSEIDRDKVLQLNKQLRDIDNSHLVAKIQNGDNELRRIFLHINSYGGTIFHGLSAMDNMLLCK